MPSLAKWGHVNTKRTGQGVDDEAAARRTAFRKVKEALTSEAQLRHSSTRSMGHYGFFVSNSFEIQFYFDKIYSDNL